MERTDRREVKERLYPVVSLFSGAMGLDLGLKAAGLSVQVAQDIDPWCVRTTLANGQECIGGDLRQLIEEDPKCGFLRKKTGLSKKRDLFAVVGGPPCQSFSTAGKRQAVNDPRGSLFKEFCHVIRELRPRFFVMENVKGLLSAAISHRPIAERDNGHPLLPEEIQGSAFKIILQEFKKLGYKVIYNILDAVYYGVPQFRERLVIIGSRDHEDIFLPVPTHFQLHQNPDHQWQILQKAISDLENNPGPCAVFSEERLKYLKMIPSGGNWHDLPKELLQTAMGGAYNSSGGKVGFYRRLDYRQPSPTLVTSPVQKATMLCHPIKDRPLSVREYARIQQFPDGWKITGNLSDCYRQIGNAVPVGLGKAIGRALVAVAEGRSFVMTKRTRGTSIHRAVAASINPALKRKE